mgnify:CR=1 FL=1
MCPDKETELSGFSAVDTAIGYMEKIFSKISTFQFFVKMLVTVYPTFMKCFIKKPVRLLPLF